jgi:hypothetical protein
MARPFAWLSSAWEWKLTATPLIRVKRTALGYRYAVIDSRKKFKKKPILTPAWAREAKSESPKRADQILPNGQIRIAQTVESESPKRSNAYKERLCSDSPGTVAETSGAQAAPATTALHPAWKYLRLSKAIGQAKVQRDWERIYHEASPEEREHPDVLMEAAGQAWQERGWPLPPGWWSKKREIEAMVNAGDFEWSPPGVGLSKWKEFCRGWYRARSIKGDELLRLVWIDSKLKRLPPRRRAEAKLDCNLCDKHIMKCEAPLQHGMASGVVFNDFMLSQTLGLEEYEEYERLAHMPVCQNAHKEKANE